MALNCCSPQRHILNKNCIVFPAVQKAWFFCQQHCVLLCTGHKEPKPKNIWMKPQCVPEAINSKLCQANQGQIGASDPGKTLKPDIKRDSEIWSVHSFFRCFMTLLGFKLPSPDCIQGGSNPTHYTIESVLLSRTVFVAHGSTLAQHQTR